MLTNWPRFLAAFLAASVAVGCSRGNAPAQREDVGVPATELDAAADASAISIDAGDAASDPSLELPPETCSPVAITWPYENDEFEKPAWGTGLDDTFTKAQFADDLSQTPPYQSLRVGVARHHESGFEWEIFWAYPGEPVRMTFLVHNILESLQDHRLYLTAVVNYRPVEARWTRWLEDRGGPSVEHVGGGVAYDDLQPAELVDLEIPADAFPRPGAYEVAVMMKSGRPGYKHANIYRRIHLFYGGFEWPKYDCFSATTDRSPSEVEELLGMDIRVIALKKGLVRLAGQTTVEDVIAPIAAERGQHVVVPASWFGQFGEGTPTASLPLLNGQPIIEEPWLFISTDDGLPEQRNVASRRIFEFELPNEAGTYDFFLVGWPDATVPAISPDRERMDAQLRSGGTSNTIRFVVD